MGYPRQAAFADSDDSFMIYRRFGYIHSRLLLNKQDELRELEANLHDMDLIDASSEEGALCLKSRQLDEERNDIQGLGPRRALLGPRRALLEKIEQKTLQYGMLERYPFYKSSYLNLTKNIKLKICFSRSTTFERSAAGGL